ncbi:ATP-dependent DNA helicase RRM3-like protein [Tanacetum coccineum]
MLFKIKEEDDKTIGQAFHIISKGIHEKGTDGAMVSAGEPPSISSTTMDRKLRLTGGSNDSYIRHMLLRERNKGWRVVVFNSRGCGHGPVRTPQVTIEPQSIITIPHDIISEILRRNMCVQNGYNATKLFIFDGTQPIVNEGFQDVKEYSIRLFAREDVKKSENVATRISTASKNSTKESFVGKNPPRNIAELNRLLENNARQTTNAATSSVGRVSLTPQKATNVVAHSSFCGTQNKTPNTQHSFVSQKDVVRNTQAEVLPNSLPTNGDQVNPVPATRKRQTPLNDISNGINLLLENNAWQTTNVSTSSLGRVSLTAQKAINVATCPSAYVKKVTSIPSSGSLMRTPTLGNSIVSPTGILCNTINNVNYSILTTNSWPSSSNPVTPVATITRNPYSPITDVSNVALQTPVVGRVTQRSNKTTTTSVTTTIPDKQTGNSTYEVGESSRRPKRSKRQALQSGMLVRFNPDEADGNNTMTMVILHLSVKNAMLWCDTYSNIRQSVAEGNNDPTLLGKPVVLSSSFTGGPRSMKQNYMDEMALCRWYGCPNLFITITCNPNWPEIARYMRAHNLSSTDRPDVMSRVFKMKLDQLMKDLKDLRLFGLIYTVEFQKRGLPYAHVCLFLHKDDKVPNVDQNDKFILAEIPDKDEDPDLYKLVSDFMMHGPCGEDDATQVCMTDGKFYNTLSLRDSFTTRSSVDSEGYPVYRRRDNGRYVESIGSQLHNGYVVRYNATLLKHYQCDINVEWCNQTGSIKYLFKYINKGPDRVLAQLYEIVTNEDDQC